MMSKVVKPTNKPLFNFDDRFSKGNLIINPQCLMFNLAYGKACANNDK